MSEETLFVAALEIKDAQRRAEFLDSECAGNLELRQRLDRLLRAHLASGEFLETPPPVAATVPLQLPPYEPGMTIDRYRLLRLLGEGGMGSVFLAEQTAPVQRQVALKLIKPGLASPQILARFDTERQVLAVLDHPNIAKVLDAGSTTTGQPYFVMELVTGTPLIEYCDTQRMHPAARIGLFIEICQAVQHAHQKGVIHRDLKPSNILVTEYDGRPVPKIIDFGVAKALSNALPEQTLHSVIGMLIGTLEYMSPEQANLGSLDVDTRSDVYTLGVVLYELLTGTTPLARKSLQTAGVGEALRLIREAETPKPSTRLSEMRDQAAAISAQRHVEPRDLTKLVQGELDWIVMKALDKDRKRRYESANSLALDLQRFLAHEPVMAGPPSHTYRVRKFVRRNRLAVAAAALVLLTLVAGIIGTSYGLWQANLARKAAEERFEIARDAVTEFLDNVTDDPELNKADFFPLRKRLLNSAIPYYQRLVKQEPQNTDQRIHHARALRRLGQIRVVTADYAEAEKVLEQGRSEFTALMGEHPPAADLRADLAIVFALLGDVHNNQGRDSLAQAHYEQAEGLYGEAICSDPDKLNNVYCLAIAQVSLANLYEARDQREKARQAYARANENYKRLVSEAPKRLTYRLGHATLLRNLALAYEEEQETEQANRHISESRQTLESIVRESKDVDCRQELALTLLTHGEMLVRRRQYAQAKAALEPAILHCQKLAIELPSLPKPRLMLGCAYNDLGICHQYLNEPLKAEEAYQHSCEVREGLVRDVPSNPDFVIELAGSYCNLGSLLSTPKTTARAHAWFAKAETVLRQIMSRPEPSTTAKLYLHNVLMNRSLVLMMDNRPADAAAEVSHAIELALPADANRDRFWRAMILAGTERHAEAVNEAWEIANRKPGRPEELVLACLVCSLAVDHVKDSAEAVHRYTEQGKSLIRAAGKHHTPGQIRALITQHGDARWASGHTQTYEAWLVELTKSESAAPPK